MYSKLYDILHEHFIVFLIINCIYFYDLASLSIITLVRIIFSSLKVAFTYFLHFMLFFYSCLQPIDCIMTILKNFIQLVFFLFYDRIFFIHIKYPMTFIF
jgi:hypothetical protein